MPTTKSAAKRLRQSQAQRAVNRATKSSVKTQVKKVRAAVAAGDMAKADEEYKAAIGKLDKAAAKRFIHKNAAARTKSRLVHLIKKAKASPPPKAAEKPKRSAKKKAT